MRVSNCGHRNLSWDENRKSYRLELRILPGKSRTARFKDLGEALKTRAEWYVERDAVMQDSKEAKAAAARPPPFNIEHGPVLVHFD
jgi:hypothetical protein